jgi:hypothetical protein
MRAQSSLRKMVGQSITNFDCFPMGYLGCIATELGREMAHAAEVLIGPPGVESKPLFNRFRCFLDITLISFPNWLGGTVVRSSAAWPKRHLAACAGKHMNDGPLTSKSPLMFHPHCSQQSDINCISLTLSSTVQRAIGIYIHQVTDPLNTI